MNKKFDFVKKIGLIHEKLHAILVELNVQFGGGYGQGHGHVLAETTERETLHKCKI